MSKLDKPELVSPCIGTCRLDPETGWCEGCLRTVAEIRVWRDASETERLAILAGLKDRRRAAGRIGQGERRPRRRGLPNH